jgi:hypothetical protein
MEKLPGILSGLALVTAGAITLYLEINPLAASSMILTGLGVSILYERKVIKEASSPVEKRLSSIIPVISESAVLLSIGFYSGYYEISLAYLGIVLISSEFLENLSEFSDINTSRLIGRLSRMIILGLGVAVAYFNSYILFYSVAAAGLTAVYDILVVISESSSGI